MYASILSQLKEARKAVEQSWRYYVTYVKVLGTLIDSCYVANEEFVAQASDGALSARRNLQQMKGWQTMMNNERREAINQLFLIVNNRATALPVVEHTCMQIASVTCHNPQDKFRELCILKVEQLLQSPDTKNLKVQITLLSHIFKDESVLLPSSFVQACIEFVVQVLENISNPPAVQLKCLQITVPHVLRYIVLNQMMFDRFCMGASFLRQKATHAMLVKTQVSVYSDISDTIGSIFDRIKSADFVK